ncbi:AtpZ/AtpI family protein [Mariniblastus sp.]|nr:AtpZ/AtpI family protein [Mariniblastus sp.]
MVDDRSPTAKAMAIVSQITSIGIALVLFTIAGRGFDIWLDTSPALLLVGIALGFSVAGFQFLRLIKKLEKDSESKTD